MPDDLIHNKAKASNGSLRFNRMKCDCNINLVLNLDVIFSYYLLPNFITGITNENAQITQHYFGGTSFIFVRGTILNHILLFQGFASINFEGSN